MQSLKREPLEKRGIYTTHKLFFSHMQYKEKNINMYENN